MLRLTTPSITKQSLLVVAVLVLVLLSGTAQADPVRGWISQSYKADRKAINQSEDWQQDQLRQRENAILDAERATWQNARKNVPPQVRTQLDREYHARRKAIDRNFDNQRDSLRVGYDNARDAIHSDYRNSVRAYNDDRRTSTYYTPTRLELWPPESGQPVYGPIYGPSLGVPRGYVQPEAVIPQEEIYGLPAGGREF